jgi:hypothetical protein
MAVTSPLNKKSNSDRPLNPKNHDRLNKKSNSDRPINTSTSRSPINKNQTAIAPTTPQYHDRHFTKIKQRSLC